MSGRFTDLEMRDPHLIPADLWGRLPLWQKAVVGRQRFIDSREWAPLDQRRFRLDPESYRTQYATANVGRLRATRVGDSLAMRFLIRLPAAEVVQIVVFERGGARFVLPGGDEPTIVRGSLGAIYSDAPGFRAETSDGNSRLMLTLPAGLVRRKLEALLEGQQVGSVAFHPVFDATSGAGAMIRRMLDTLFAELARSDSLLENEIAIRSFEEHLTLCLLLGMPHNYSQRLLQLQTPAAPANVRRAENFMHANADTPLTIVQIADAAQCSVRALQMAFRRFRGTTPMAALRRIRLDEARNEMLRAGRPESLGRIAAGHGFSNPGRFAQLFRRTYGAYPSTVIGSRRGTAGENWAGDAAVHAAD